MQNKAMKQIALEHVWNALQSNTGVQVKLNLGSHKQKNVNNFSISFAEMSPHKLSHAIVLSSQ